MMKLFLVFYLVGQVSYVSDPVQFAKEDCDYIAFNLQNSVDDTFVSKHGHTKEDLTIRCEYHINPPKIGSILEDNNDTF